MCVLINPLTRRRYGTPLALGYRALFLIYDSLLIVNAYMQRVKTKLA